MDRSCPLAPRARRTAPVTCVQVSDNTGAVIAGGAVDFHMNVRARSATRDECFRPGVDDRSQLEDRIAEPGMKGLHHPVDLPRGDETPFSEIGLQRVESSRMVLGPKGELKSLPHEIWE